MCICCCRLTHRAGLCTWDTGGSKKSQEKLKRDDGSSSSLEVFEGVLGFKLECRGNGVCLAACMKDGDTPEIGLPFSIPTNQISHTAQPFFLQLGVWG